MNLSNRPAMALKPAPWNTLPAVVLLCFLFLTLSSWAFLPLRAAAGLTVSNGTGESSLDWLTPAFEHYLDYALHHYGPPQAFPPPAFTVEYFLEGDRVVFSIDYHVEGGGGGSTEITGPLGETALWLTEIGKVAGAALQPGLSRGEGIPPPTASTEALRLFAATSAAAIKEKEGLLRAALELDPSFHDALFRLSVTAAAKERYDEACSLVIRYLEYSPGNVAALRNAAVCLAATAREAEAVDLLRKVAEADPGDRPARYALARTLLAAGNPEEADRVYGEIIENYPDQGEAVFEQALLRVREGDLPGARAIISGLSRERSREARRFFYRRGEEELGAGRVAGSLEAFTLAGLVDPGDIQAGLALGLVSYQKGDFKGAVRRFEEILRVSQGDPGIYRYLAMAYERLGDQGTALDYYRKATEMSAEGNSGRWAKDLFLGSMARSREAAQLLPVLATPFRTGFSSRWIESPAEEGVAGEESPPLHPESDGGGTKEGRPESGAAAGLEEEIYRYRTQNSTLTEQVREKEEQAVFVAKEALAAQKKLREAQARIAGMEERLKGRGGQSAGLPGSPMTQEEEGRAGSLRKDLEKRVREQDSSLEEYRGRIEALGRSLEEKEGELEAIRGREAEFEGELLRKREEQAALEKELREFRGRLGEWESNRDLLRERLEGKEKELGVLEGDLASIRSRSAENESLRTLNTRLATKIRDIAARLVRLSSELEDREREIGRMKSRLDAGR